MILHNAHLRKTLHAALAFMAVLVLPIAARSQSTAIVGNGSSSGSSDGPIYRSSASSSFDYSSYHYLFTQTELNNAGLLPGVVLSDIAWYKTNTTQTNGPADMEIWVKNSNLTSVQSAPQSYSNITNGATLVYSTNSQTFAAVSGWQNFTFNNLFIYTGGALEVTVFWDISGVSGSPTNGSFIWKRDNISNRTIAYSSSTNGTTFNSSKSTRAQTRFTYISCLAPGNLNATNITTSSADVSWGAVSGSTGYEYVVNQNPNAPSASGTAVAGTNATATGLLLNTQYYLHVRNRCSATSYSPWATFPFMTADAYCKPPVNILYSNLTSNGVDVLWGSMTTTDHYEYYLDVTPGAPVSGLNTTTGITANFNNLSPATKYYFFIRSVCLGGNDSSTWRIDSFVTHNSCDAPEVSAQNITAVSADVSWPAVTTAYSYEYAVTTSVAHPAFGTEVFSTAVTVSIDPNEKTQYVHVRTKCNDQFTFSAWDMAVLKDEKTVVPTSGPVSALIVYPNPVSGYMFINNAVNAHIAITDMKGTVIKEADIDIENYKMDCAAMPPGLYILHVRTATSNTKTKFTKL